MTHGDSNSPMACARALFQAQGLPAPPMPAALAAALRPHGTRVFATRELPSSPYGIDAFLGELVREPGLPDYAVAGFDGHGISSWAAHLYVVSGPLAMFIQLPWGGAFLDAAPARREIEDIFGWAAKLQAAMRRAAKAASIPAGWRLSVAASRLGRAGWRWSAPGRGIEQHPWQPPGGMRAALLALADDLASGRQVLTG